VDSEDRGYLVVFDCSLCALWWQGKVHVSVVASVTQPERVSSQITNTFIFVFAVNLAPAQAQSAVPAVRRNGRNAAPFPGFST
jgi:hypothetical protein